MTRYATEHRTVRQTSAHAGISVSFLNVHQSLVMDLSDREIFAVHMCRSDPDVRNWKLNSFL